MRLFRITFFDPIVEMNFRVAIQNSFNHIEEIVHELSLKSSSNEIQNSELLNDIKKFSKDVSDLVTNLEEFHMTIEQFNRPKQKTIESKDIFQEN